MNFGTPKFEIQNFVLSQSDAKGLVLLAGSLLASLFAFFAPFRG